MNYREKALRFGETSPLVGVLTEPLPRPAPGGGPAVIFLNSGILHRVGACRLHVHTARGLASQGTLSLRFDHAGIGDSDPRRDNLAFEDAAAAEVGEAMDYIENKRGISDFILFGLCSGADIGFRVAQTERRVVGLVSLDAYAYPSRWTPWRYYAKRSRHYATRMVQPQAWKRAIRTRIDRMRSERGDGRPIAVDGSDPQADYPNYVREFPPRDVVEEGLRMLIARGTRLLFVYTGVQPHIFNHRGQFWEMYASLSPTPAVWVDYLPEATHIFTGLHHQRFVIQRTCEWVRDGWQSSTIARSDEPVATAG